MLSEEDIPMPPLPEEIILVLAPFAQLFSDRVWLHAQVWCWGRFWPRATHGDRCLRVMGLGLERHFTNYHRVLNRASGQPARAADFVGVAGRAAGAAGRDDRARGGRYGGAPQRAEDQGQGVLPRCGALLQETRGQVFWAEVGVDDAAWSRCPGPAGVGVAVFDGAVLAREKRRTAPA